MKSTMTIILLMSLQVLADQIEGFGERIITKTGNNIGFFIEDGKKVKVKKIKSCNHFKHKVIKYIYGLELKSGAKTKGFNHPELSGIMCIKNEVAKYVPMKKVIKEEEPIYYEEKRGSIAKSI